MKVIQDLRFIETLRLLIWRKWIQKLEILNIAGNGIVINPTMAEKASNGYRAMKMKVIRLWYNLKGGMKQAIKEDDSEWIRSEKEKWNKRIEDEYPPWDDKKNDFTIPYGIWQKQKKRKKKR
jgi:hypothetical protein